MTSQVVPWYNYKEWLNVYNYVCADSAIAENKAEVLKQLHIWKMRCPSLPSGIEATLGLMQVNYEDMKSSNQLIHRNVLRLAYSTAIIRFVNHMLDSEHAKGVSLYRAAKQLGVPEWIIDLRHDTAHNNSLPTLELLREATSVALEWLRRNYWDKHNNVLRDYVVGDYVDSSENDNKIQSLIRFYVTLSICLHSSCKAKNLADIEDDDMRDQFISEINELFEQSVDLSDLKSVTLKYLLTLTKSQFKKLLEWNNINQIVAKTLVDKNSLFLSYEVVELLGEKEFKQNKLSRSYLNCFEELLTFLHSSNLILDLVMELIAVTTQTTYTDNVCKLAALWVSQILRAFTNSNMFLSKMAT